MRLLFTGLMLLMLTGCSSGGAMSDPAQAFVGVSDSRSFWIRYHEIASNAYYGRDYPEPYAYKACLADELMKVTPANVDTAVEQFIKSKSKADFQELSTAADAFARTNAQDIDTARGECDNQVVSSYFDRFSGVNSRRDFIMVLAKIGAERDGTDINSMPAGMVECMADDTQPLYPETTLLAIDQFVKDHSRSSFDRVLELSKTSPATSFDKIVAVANACKAKVGA